MELAEIRRIVAAKLSETRARHTESVAALAIDLAGLVGEDPARAELAAWLHDCAKHMSIDEQIAFAARERIALSENDFISKGVIHSRLGAWLAVHEYGVRDAEVVSAVLHHSTGRARMPRFEKLLMAADYLEPNRPFDFREATLAEVRADFERGMLAVIGNRLLAVIAKGRPVHPDSIAFYNSQLSLVRGWT
jgi:predicted HD superfamily hydrolase involved in NAD metabolism